MRNLTGALVFSTTLLLAVGCHKNTGESPDAATDVGASREALHGGKDAASPDATQAGSGSSAVESCVDRWLTAHDLDRFGSPSGTMYTGGTPLFDERTGESRDRLTFVFERQPEAKKACASGDAGK
ncbi:hypothetical protein JGU66_16480 [Myxococcaceae bacterium JPH2]|nr:hypothetical protein [Myxococcaceae bacterium JPH2]